MARAALIACALGGCAPQVARVPVPRIAALGWEGLATSKTPGAVAPGDDYWQRIGPSELTRLIDVALAGNPSFEGALARIAQVRGDLRTAGAPLLPSVGTSGGLTARESRSFNTAQYSTAAASAGLDLAWEIDLFGGLRAGKRAAAERYRAAGLDAAATRLLVECEVARAYIQLAAIDDRSIVLDRSIANAREILRLTDLRIAADLAMPGDRGVEAVELKRLEAQRSQYRQARTATLSALAALLGAEAPGFTVAPATLDSWHPPAIDPGAPADLLLRRPDLRAAEARIAAANGDIDQARAAFLPSLRVSAAGLAQAAALDGPFGWTLSAASSLVAPIFAGGRLKGRLDTATARQAETVAVYRQALLTALKEGVDALAAEAGARERQGLFASAREDARASRRIAQMRYAEGEADLSAVLDAERAALAAEDGVAVAMQERLFAAVDLYKALGGRPGTRP